MDLDNLKNAVRSAGGDPKKSSFLKKLLIIVGGGAIGEKLGILGGGDEDIGLP